MKPGHKTQPDECSEGFVAIEEHDEMMRWKLPHFDDILFSPEAPLGTFALVDQEDIAFDQHLIRFRMRSMFFHSRFYLDAMLADHLQPFNPSGITGKINVRELA